MKLITLFAAIAAAVPAALADLTINTPASVVECEPTQFNWSGGQAPYFLTLVPAGQSSASPLKQFPTQQGTSYTWNVDLESGTSVTIALKDSSGATAYSSIITIQAGTSSSCVNTSVQESGGSGSSPASTGGSGSTPTSTGGSGSPPATTAGSGSSGSSAGPSSSSTTTAAGSNSTSTSSKSSGAGRLSVTSAFGVAGVMGLVGAAFF